MSDHFLGSRAAMQVAVLREELARAERGGHFTTVALLRRELGEPPVPSSTPTPRPTAKDPAMPSALARAKHSHLRSVNAAAELERARAAHAAEVQRIEADIARAEATLVDPSASVTARQGARERLRAIDEAGLDEATARKMRRAFGGGGRLDPFSARDAAILALRGESR